MRSRIGVILSGLEPAREAVVDSRTQEHVQAAGLFGQLRSVDAVAAVALGLDSEVLRADCSGRPRQTYRSAQAGAGWDQAGEGEEDRSRASSHFVVIAASEVEISGPPIQTCEEELAREVVAGLELTESSCMSDSDSYCHSR